MGRCVDDERESGVVWPRAHAGWEAAGMSPRTREASVVANKGVGRRTAEAGSGLRICVCAVTHRALVAIVAILRNYRGDDDEK